jgi:hypothetical protein
MTPITFRPLKLWPQDFTQERKRSPFDSPWSATLDLLDHELFHLRAQSVVLEIALSEYDIRRDGLPRANARAPEHPGVILSFDSAHGSLCYLTDVFTDWQSNLRAIALGLESLRRVDRYGITKRGEQYTGWLALPAPRAAADRGRELIEKHGGLRAALFATHPDHGGNTDDFHAVKAAKGSS